MRTIVPCIGLVPRRSFSIMLVAVSLLLASACTLKIDYTLNVLDAENASAEILLSGDDLMAMMLQEGFEDGEFAKDGWTAEEVTRSEELFVVRLRHAPGPVDEMMKGLEDGEMAQPSATLTTTELPSFVEYRLDMSVPPSEPDTDADGSTSAAGMDGIDFALDNESDEFIDEFMQFSFTINLPGSIVESNADEQSEQGGTWHLTAERRRQGMEMHMVSQVAR